MSDAANDNDRSFTGHVHDTASGLTYMQARYYHPVTGRFLSNDPVGFGDNGDTRYFNRYAYTANDPVNATDPTGMDLEVEIKAYVLDDTSSDSATMVDNGQDTDGEYGHAFVQYTDTDTGESMITNAFPTDKNGGAAAGALFPNGSVLGARNDEASQNIDSKRNGVTFDKATVPVSLEDAKGTIEHLVEQVNSSDIPYSGSNLFGDNSNNYAGEAFERLTGRAAVNTSGMALPGLESGIKEVNRQ